MIRTHFNIFLNTKILCWNCQGVDHSRFQSFVKEYCKEFSPSLLYLLETQISGVRANNVIAKLGFVNSFRVEANGFASGI